jgi:hypothetical protein
MKLLIQRKKNTEIIFSERDYAISAYALQENIQVLKRFVKDYGFIPLDEEAFTQLMSSGEAKEVNKYYIVLRNKIIFFVEELNWKSLNIIFSVFNALNRKKALESALEYNLNISSTLAVLKAKHEEVIREVDKAREELNKAIKFFNLNKFLQICSNESIETKVTANNIILKFKDIQFDCAEGSIFYNQILVEIKDLKIEGYVLKFNDFTYSTYWNLPFKLHPFLDVPYGRNNFLAFMPHNDYATFIRELKSCVIAPNGEGRDIIQTYLDLQKLWGIYKDEYTDEMELSKKIMKIKKELVENKD